jgi:hypothetical protein
MGGHGLPKVLLGPAMPYPSTPCDRVTHETALWPFQGWPAHRAGVLQLYSTPLDTPRRTPMLTIPTSCDHVGSCSPVSMSAGTWIATHKAVPDLIHYN